MGIVGATGAGKSTLINLLLRFYDVTSGRILVDGVDVRAMDLQRAARRSSAWSCRTCTCSRAPSPQHPAGQRRHHRRAGARRPRAPSTPTGSSIGCRSGYDHPVAERGATLSVGQKQLLSFARALAFDPAILVLDEATSSVDTETELTIRDALKVLMAGRTTLAIAHRLSTIQDMDKILVLHRGELREAGTHQELLARRGIYYKLYQLQFKDQERRAVTAPVSPASRTRLGCLAAPAASGEPARLSARLVGCRPGRRRGGRTASRWRNSRSTSRACCSGDSSPFAGR